MIRYKLDKDVRYIWGSKDWRDRIEIPLNQTIFVDIIEKTEEYFFLKLYLNNGEVIWGFVNTSMSPIVIHNYTELFDGRFNA